MLATNLTISPSHNLCNFREIVNNGVGAGFHETLSQTVAVRNADGHTVGVATHENVEVGVAYDDGVLEYLAICGCTLRSLLLVHRLEHGERLHERQTYRCGYLLVAVLRQMHGVESAVEGVEYNGLRVGDGAVEVENHDFLHIACVL